MVRWFGSKYKRSDGSLRDRSDGTVYSGVKKENKRYKGTGKLGVEPVHATPYSKNVRSNSQAVKDLKSFHQKIPSQLKRYK